MTERLLIDHIGPSRRPRGRLDAGRTRCSYPMRCRARPIEVERVPGHPDRRHLLRGRYAEPRAHRAVLPALRRLRRQRYPALGGGALSPNGSAIWSSPRSHQAGLDAPVGELIDATADGRRRATFHARRHAAATFVEVGFAGARATTSSASTAARSWRPRSTAPLTAAPWAVAEALAAGAQAARHPGDRDRCRASTWTCAAQAQLNPARMTARSAQVAHKHRLARHHPPRRADAQRAPRRP